MSLDDSPAVNCGAVDRTQSRGKKWNEIFRRSRVTSRQKSPYLQRARGPIGNPQDAGDHRVV